jgi:hypothetical protein
MSYTRSEFPAGLSASDLTVKRPDPSVERLLFRKRSGRVLIAFCFGVAATLACQFFYSDAARETVANAYPQLGWLAPQAEPVAQSAPNRTAFDAPSTPAFDQQQLSAMSLNLDAVRQSIDRIAVGQEGRTVLAAPSTPAFDQQQLSAMSLNLDAVRQSIDRIAAGQDGMTRSLDQIASSLAASQEQMTRSTDQTATGIGQALSANASGVKVESRDDAASLQPAARLNIKPTQAKPSEKPLSAASAQDPSCLPSASAVLQNHPGSSPSWTLRAPGHEGTKCWHAATRTMESDQTKASDEVR